jgi:pyruvate,water dikinase
MFSSHPSSGEPLVIIESAWGLRETLVIGSVSPDNYVVDRPSRKILSKTVAKKEIMTIMEQSTGDTITLPVPSDKREAMVLSDNEIMEFAKYAELLEDHYGIPQDIEFGIEDNKIYILQSRPITIINNAKQGSKAKTRRSDGRNMLTVATNPPKGP